MTTPRPPDRFSLASRARALSLILSEEFGVPFAFYGANAEPVLAGEEHVDPDLARVAREGRAVVHPLGERHLRVLMVLFEANQAILVAVGTLGRVAAAGPEQGAREVERVQKWAQAVADRLRLGDRLARQRRSDEEHAAQLKRAWEVVLGVDTAVRNLRPHRDPGKARHAILEAARAFLDARTLLWVPRHGAEPVVVEGEACLADDDSRRLADLLGRAAGASPAKPVLWNGEGAWSARFPSVANVLAFPLRDRGQAGWVIALNKRPAREGEPPAPFRSADAAALSPFAALLELQVRSWRRYHDLKGLLVGLTRALTAALDAKDPYTYGHSERVARIAVELAAELGLSEEERSDVYLAGLLHDVGKIGIRDAVLTKNGPLTPEEFEHVKQHPTIGYRILAGLGPLHNLLPGVLSHHERVDGKGYPEGLAGDGIPLLARILAVADSYDAMSAHRPYRQALTAEQVEEQLRQGASTQWDRRVIEAFWRCRQRVHQIRQRGVGESLTTALDGALRNLGGSSAAGRLVALP